MSSEPYKFEPHRPSKLASLPWMHCQKCGLVYLRNAFSQWAIRMGCNNEDHPQHERYRRGEIQ